MSILLVLPPRIALSSKPEELHLQPLTERSMNLSAHPLPSVKHAEKPKFPVLTACRSYESASSCCQLRRPNSGNLPTRSWTSPWAATSLITIGGPSQADSGAHTPYSQKIRSSQFPEKCHPFDGFRRQRSANPLDQNQSYVPTNPPRAQADRPTATFRSALPSSTTPPPQHRTCNPAPHITGR